MRNSVETIDEYIAPFPKEIQSLLQSIRVTIRKAAPKAEETISYGMPTFKLYGNLVHFAAWKNHLGFYPAPIGIAAFKKELARFEQSKGAVQFPINSPLPLPLIARIVKFRSLQNMEKWKVKQKKKVRQS